MLCVVYKNIFFFYYSIWYKIASVYILHEHSGVSCFWVDIRQILDKNSKLCFISLLKILLYGHCSFLRLVATSKEDCILALDHFTYILSNYVYNYTNISPTRKRQGKVIIDNSSFLQNFLCLLDSLLQKRFSARMSMACGSPSQLMLSHNVTTEPSAWDPSVLLKECLMTRDGLRMYHFFNRWHTVV